MVDETSPRNGEETNSLKHSNFPSAGESISSVGQLFGILANRRRRYALRFLVDAGDVVEFADLVDAVIELERAFDGPLDDHRERVRTDLYHVHLPKLVDAGVLEFDCRSRTIRYHQNDVIETSITLVAESG